MKTLVTDVSFEPLSILEAKAHLRVHTEDEDLLIENLISAARKHVEGVTRRAIGTQTWDITYSSFHDIEEIPLPPLQSVTHIKYYDADNAEQTLASTVYEVTGDDPAKVVLATDQDWPEVYERTDAVTIRIVTGYDTIPATIKAAMLLLIGHWYENREQVAVGSIATSIPYAVDALLGQYVVHYVK